MLALLLLTPPLLLADALRGLPLAPLGALALAPPLMYAAGQIRLYERPWRGLSAFPALLLLGSGMSLSNSLAVFSALLGRRSAFRRTPKFAGDWAGSAMRCRCRRACCWNWRLCFTRYGRLGWLGASSASWRHGCWSMRCPSARWPVGACGSRCRCGWRGSGLPSVRPPGIPWGRLAETHDCDPLLIIRVDPRRATH